MSVRGEVAFMVYTGPAWSIASTEDLPRGMVKSVWIPAALFFVDTRTVEARATSPEGGAVRLLLSQRDEGITWRRSDR